MLPPRLSSELENISKEYKIEVVEEADFINLIFQQFPASAHFNHPTTTMLLRIPRAYPDAGPDMFWTDIDLKLADGNIPKQSDSLETYMGRQWRRFSWHHNRWNPNVDNLHSYIDFVRRRFNER
jgi:hypothetical protein